MSPAAPLRTSARPRTSWVPSGAPRSPRPGAGGDNRRGTGRRLRLVSAPPSPRRRLPFAATCAGLLALTLVSLLMLNISLSRGAYQLHELEQRQSALTEEQQALSERLAAEAAPGRLAERAAALGMVRGPNPGLLRLADGAVLGDPAPASAAPPSPAAP
jgi:hypothetical protein